MKKILGLDLGTTSIGWAYVLEGEGKEPSSIEQIGVRVNPLTTDEQTNFEKGKPITTNADRTLKRGMRRNLDRYQLRRNNLISIFKKENWISSETPLAETEKGSTHSTYFIRAKAASEKITKEELARVLLAINKKRGYKSSRKAKNDDEGGQLIDGMAIAKQLYEEKITPGQLVYRRLSEGKKFVPDFYRSDLVHEFDSIWEAQKQYYPDIFTDNFKKDLEGKGSRATSALFWKTYNFNTAENKGTRDEKKLKSYKWRAEALDRKLEKEEVAYVLTEINNDLNKSSGYLGAISDRSKELYFNHQTVGQYLYGQLKENPHTRLANQVFYRQDYLDEFERIWHVQQSFHPELTETLKAEIRDIVIFYQRKLKSQKGLINFCEFEQREITEKKNNVEIKRIVGLRVCPRSSPLFQEFKIWQVLGNVVFKNKLTKEKQAISQEDKEFLFTELNLKGNLKTDDVLKLLGQKPKEWDANYSELQGNLTNMALFESYLKILEIEGYDVTKELKEKLNKDEILLKDLTSSALEITQMVKDIFAVIGIDTAVLDFDAQLEGKKFENQSSYKLWHLLYSYEGDDSNSGNNKLYEVLQKNFGFKLEHAKILANVSLVDDYGSLSAKAIRRMYPFIKENQYDEAAILAKYKHSKLSLTREELATRALKPTLELLKKNSLRNPVVEKILNQLVNVVNTLIIQNSIKDDNGKIIEYFKFDEIRIELARELKKNAKERQEMTTNIEAAKRKHEGIIKLLQHEFNIKNPTRNDIIRFKLYQELKNNSYKDIYTNTYIPREKLFSKEIDIDHVIPQSKLFDDSFSNKVLAFRKDNLKKGNRTAFDYILSEHGENSFLEFKIRAEHLFALGSKNAEEGISKAKLKKLLMPESEIGEGFIARDLRDSQYIAKKAKGMLFEICKSVVSTTGSVTDRLREDWGLINIMQELNFQKYKTLGLTEFIEKKDGSFKERIIDWTKRNDHRHHAMDALTVAFTKHNHIQYLNYLSARKNEYHKLHNVILNIENLETELITDEEGNRSRLFKEPIPNFRQLAKEKLEGVLISHKAKNKVVTRNKNITKKKIGTNTKIELSPRGQLHKETIYGRYQYYVQKEIAINAQLDETTISKISNPSHKNALLNRLKENGNDPKKAFAGKNAPSKSPVFIDIAKTISIPEKVKIVWLEEDYSIRKDVNPENFKELKSIDKVIDSAAKKALIKRLSDFNGNAKAAFSDLDKNPIWLNQSAGICLKRVTISGVKNAEALHYKRDLNGKQVLDDNGSPIPVDFVSTGNNHHVAIYKDADDKLQENVVSFYEAVTRAKMGLAVIDKSYNLHLGWEFQFSMKQNEMFVFPNEKTGFNPAEIDLLDAANAKAISPNMFRVQKIASKNYFFRHHLETDVSQKKELVGITFKPQLGLGAILGIEKVRLNHLGQIIHVGAY